MSVEVAQEESGGGANNRASEGKIPTKPKPIERK